MSTFKSVNSCDLCGSDKFTVISDRGVGITEENIVRCECGLIFQSPRQDEQYWKHYYMSDTFSEQHRRGRKPNNAHVQFAYSRAKGRLEKIGPYLKDCGSLLDVGCGGGYFVEMADVPLKRGIDMSTHWLPKGENFIHGKFPDDMPDMKFDVITAFHVLEHVCDPNGFLGGVHKHLNDGGLFVVEYPDVLRRAKRQGVEYSVFFSGAHVYEYTFDTMTRMLDKNGFTVSIVEFYDGKDESDKNVLLVCGR